jgi:phage regulator Rha-like protein
MTTNTKQRAAGAMNSNGLHTHTNAANFDSHGSLDQAVDGKAISMTDDFALTTTSTEARVDTRLLARQMGNKHKPVVALIDKYLSRFKAHGQVLFKKADGDRKQGGGMAERFALLSEDQAYFLLSLSRNTDTVVALKSKLIAAFSNARRAADLRKTEYLPQYHQLHDRIGILAAGSTNERHVHSNVNRLLNKFAGIEAGQRANAAMPHQAMLIVGQLVASNATLGATDHHDGYQRIKTNLTALQGVIALEMQP